MGACMVEALAEIQNRLGYSAHLQIHKPDGVFMKRYVIINK
jgi:hypothetical protein